MSEDFEFFYWFFNNWNFNNMSNKPGIDPFNNKKLDPFSYNLMKFNTVILLKEILKNTRQFMEVDVLEWIKKNV